MAKILPELSQLPEILEGSRVTFTFSAEFDADELLSDLKIIESDLPSTIVISGASFSGKFSNLFSLDQDSIKYCQGDQLKTASRFSDLPPKTMINIYSYQAPSVLKKTFNIKVSLDYLKGPDGAEVPLNITKWYTQPIQGTWDTFTKQFLEYVK